jgi:hypothetical protein
MRRMIAVLLALLCIVGCTSSRTGTRVEPTPASEASSVSPEAQDVFPGVPRHPGAEAHGLATPPRAYIRVRSMGAAEVLSWYRSNLSRQGWRAGPTVLPADRVLVVTKDGQYLSLSAHDAPDGSAVVWFHLRSAAEVTADEAIVVASASDHTPVQWTASYISEFESNRWYADGTKHPVWTVTGQQEGIVRVVVNVDAITAEPFQINTIEGK